MKTKIIFRIIVVVYLIICITLCVRVNNKKYDKWIETQARITDVSIAGEKRTFRSNGSTIVDIMVNYLDNDRLMIFYNYYPHLNEGDVIMIKYNPENQRDIIYLPYEEHCVSVKRRNIIIFFSVIMLFTVVIYLVKRAEEVDYTEENHYYWFPTNDNDQKDDK